MTLILKRLSLVAQVVGVIRLEILRNVWREWMPSERELSRTLHVSRNTCRAALNTLRQEKLIEPVVGRGTRVNRTAVRKLRSAATHIRSVGIIIPDAMSKLRPNNAQLINGVRNELFDFDMRVELHESSAYYKSKPGHALDKLVEKNRHDCWILMLSKEPLQRWFADRHLPCLVSGSVYSGIELPSFDLDYRAIGRHAAGTLIALGCRHIVFLNRSSRSAGDLESELGFMEGVRASSHADVEARVAYHDDDRKSVAHLIQSLFSPSHRPDGLLVANSYCYLSAVSALAQRGFKIPADVSLISRDDDQFLAYVEPEPARYLNDLGGGTRKIVNLIRSLVEGTAVKPESIHIVPQFIAGCSSRRRGAPG